MSNASFIYAIIFAAAMHILAGIILTLPEPEHTLNKAPTFIKLKLGHHEAPSRDVSGHLPKKTQKTLSRRALAEAQEKLKKTAPEPLAALEPAAGKEPEKNIEKTKTPPKKAEKKTVVRKKIMPPKQSAAKKQPPKRAPAKQVTPHTPKHPLQLAGLATHKPTPASAVKGTVLGDTKKKEALDTHSYRQILTAWFKKHQYYPASARQQYIEGEPDVHIIIDQHGNILYSEIVETSGSPLLDKAAYETIKRANPVPKPPQGYRMDAATNTAEFVLPFTFSLNTLD